MNHQRSVITALLTLALVAFAGIASAQTELSSNFAAAGISYSPGATPAIAGTGLYAKRIGSTGTYAFTVVDALPSTYKPLTVTTQFATGVAVKVVSLGSVALFIPTAAGISYSGTNTGWGWSTGGMASIPISRTWRALPNVRVVKSSISNGTGYQLIGGVLIGWGW